MTGAPVATVLGMQQLQARGVHSLLSSSESSTTTTELLKYVNVRIGTGGHGHLYPGATVPFGMVQLSPDTYNFGWDWCSGYHDSDTSIMGFSHTHLSGTGVGDMLDFLVMPCTGAVKTSPGTREQPELGYRSRFSRDDEHAVPGYYSVLLKDYGVRAELSATERAGIHRYTFPASETSHLVLDLDHGYANEPGAIHWSSLKVMGRDTICGGKSTNRWASGREIYFAMKFPRPFDRIEVLADGKPVEDLSQEIHAASLKAIVHYSTKADEKILIKTGISGVDIQGAIRNLDSEIPAWDFDGVRQAAMANCADVGVVCHERDGLLRSGPHQRQLRVWLDAFRSRCRRSW